MNIIYIYIFQSISIYYTTSFHELMTKSLLGSTCIFVNSQKCSFCQKGHFKTKFKYLRQLLLFFIGRLYRFSFSRKAMFKPFSPILNSEKNGEVLCLIRRREMCIFRIFIACHRCKFPSIPKVTF